MKMTWRWYGEGKEFTPSPDPLLAELFAGPGAVHRTLHKYVSAR